MENQKKTDLQQSFYVFYFCETNFPKFSDLKQQAIIACSLWIRNLGVAYFSAPGSRYLMRLQSGFIPDAASSEGLLAGG